jgi:phage terminase small subunit
MTLDKVRETFVKEYHKTGNATESLRRANPKCLKWKPDVVNVKASQMLKEDKVQLRLSELRIRSQERSEKEHDVSIASLTKMAKAAYDLAMTPDVAAPAAAITAVLAIGKLHGLVVDKKEVTRKRDASDFDDTELYAIARMGRARVDQTEGSSEGLDCIH